MKPSFYDRVMYSGHDVNVVRATRNAGKTTLGIDWATKGEDRNVLFLVPNQVQVTMIADKIEVLYQDQVSRRIQNRAIGSIQIHGGKNITIFSALSDSSLLRGRIFDKIIVDEAGRIPDSYMDFINKQKAMFGAKLLILLNTIRDKTVGSYFEVYEPVANYISYDLYDATREGLYNKDDLIRMIYEYADDIFRDEYGPWDRFWKKGKINNENVSCLLKKEGL